MRIVQAIETAGPGGAERVFICLCRGLGERGHDVRALLLRDGWLRTELERFGVDVTILGLRGSMDRRFLAGFREFLRTSGTEVVHAHEFTLAYYGALAARRTGPPLLTTVHGKNFVAGIKRRAAGKVLFRRKEGRTMVAVSSELAAHVSRRLGLGSGRVLVVPNGVEVAGDPSAPPRASDEPLRLLAVGNLYPVKNHQLLIRVMGRLDSAGVDARLDILGRGAEEPRLRALVEELGLEDKVALRGFREDVGEFLRRSHLLVSGSLSEGMPVSFLEAMAAGLPVVAPRVGGIPELIDHDRQGLLYDCNDADSLELAVKRLAGAEPVRRELGAQAFRRVREEYSEAAMIQRYSDLYNGLASAPIRS